MNTIILIGGLPRCGKSTLATYLLEKHQIPYYSTDILSQVINASFPSSGIDVDAPLEQKIETFAPVLRMLIKTLSFQKGIFAIEGDVITPSIITEARKHYTIRACILGSTTATPENYQIRTGGGYDWISERSQEEVEALVKEVVEKSSTYKAVCAEEGILYAEIDPNSEEESLASLAHTLLLLSNTEKSEKNDSFKLFDFHHGMSYAYIEDIIDTWSPGLSPESSFIHFQDAFCAHYFAHIGKEFPKSRLSEIEDLLYKKRAFHDPF